MSQNQVKYRPLNEKQIAFCKFYITNNNGLQSAIEAGFSKRSARTTSSDLLKRPDIQEKLRELREEIKKKEPLVTAEFIIGGLKEVAERCLQRKPVMEWDHSQRALVQATDEAGNNVWTFDSTGANKAFELLGKHLGIFERDTSKDQPLIRVEITKNTVIINNNDGSSTSHTDEETGCDSSDSGGSIYTMLPPITEE